jgi:intergrase/recombinase
MRRDRPIKDDQANLNEYKVKVRAAFRTFLDVVLASHIVLEKVVNNLRRCGVLGRRNGPKLRDRILPIFH